MLIGNLEKYYFLICSSTFILDNVLTYYLYSFLFCVVLTIARGHGFALFII
jgi:hypothetical protein